MNESVKTFLHMAENAVYRERNYKKAIEFLKDAINLDPTTVRAYILKGSCEIHLVQYSNAVISLNAALNYDPDCVEALLNLAYISIQVGDYEQAKDYVRHVLNVKKVSDAYEFLADIEHVQHEFNNAIEYYDQAIQLAPGSDELYRKKALCLGELKQYKEAIRFADLAYELNNSNLRARDLAEAMTDEYFSRGRGFWAGLLLKLQKPYLQEKLREEIRLYEDVKKAKKAADDLNWDSVFGIRTKAYFDSQLPDLVNTAKKNGKKLSVLLFDVDDMKVFNEHYGHACTNQLLGFTGEFLRDSNKKKFPA